MFKHQQQSTVTTGNRILRGFSLIEILVVLMILGILTALIVSAMGPLLGNAKVEETRVTIARVNEVIQARYDAVRKADVSVEAKKVALLTSGLTEKDATFLIKKTLYRQALPQRPEDMFGLDQAVSAADNAPYAADWISGPGATSSNGDYRLCAEVLLFALTNGSSVRALPGGKSYPVPLLELDTINQNHIQDIDGNDVPELVDSWDQPLWLFNFPTRLIRPGGGTNSIDTSNAGILISGLPTDTTDNGPLGQDPLDATGLLFDRLSNQYATGGNLTYRPPSTSTSVLDFTAANYHDADTYYAPLLMSAGPDGLTDGEEGFGFGNPAGGSGGDRLGEVSNAAALTDNITNLQQ